MDENKKFYDLYGYQYSPIEVNNWMLYQQSYINFPPYEVFPANIGLNYGNIPIPNSYNQSFSPNFSPENFNNNLLSGTSLTPSENTSFHKNIISEIPKQSKKSPRFQTENICNQKNNQNKVKSDCQQGSSFSNTSIEVLNRNKKCDEEKFRKAFPQTPKVDMDKEFPPISGSVQTEQIVEHEKMLDFKLALQKPKQVPIEKNKENLKLNDNLNETNEKPKKKRKRNRKKKVVEKPVEPFSFVEDEFPSLDLVKIVEKPQIIQETTPENEEIKINKPNPLIDKKKIRKRQLLFILPGDMEGQVRVIQAPTIQKKKTKRKITQDRMKRPIGLLNPLDLSAPPVKRGKERLKPKIKKPSKLKKTILHYRNLKKELREKANSDALVKEESEKCIIDNPPIIVTEKKSENFINKIHSKNFREYCNHMVDNKINSIISQLLKTLIGFQDRLYNRDPIKAKMKRRLCFGLREVTKFVNMKKLRLIIIAPDLEKIEIEGGLDDIVSQIIKKARESGIPYVFGLSRSSLAYLCYKKFRVGAIGIFNYDGAEVQVKDLLVSVDQARDQYNQIKQIMESISQDVSTFSQSLNIGAKYSSNDICDPTLINGTVPFNSGHSRTPSNALSEPISDIGDMNKLLFNSIEEDQIKCSSPDPTTADQQLSDDHGDGDDNYEGDVEDQLIGEYVENILQSVSRLNLEAENIEISKIV